MRIIIGKKEVQMVPRDVKIAKHLIADFLTSVRTAANENDAPTLYFTVLVLMHLMSQDQINTITPETLGLFLNARYVDAKKHDEKEGK